MIFSWKWVAGVICLAYLIGSLYNVANRPVRGKKNIPGVKIQDQASKRILSSHTGDEYSFADPYLAYYVLTELDIFEPVADEYFAYRINGSEYETPYLGLKNDDVYCLRHRNYFTKNASSLFVKNFILEASFKHIIRTRVVPAIGNDIQPKVHRHMPADLKNNRTYDVSATANHFWTSTSLGVYKHVGKHYSCLTQSSNHILGVSTLNRKDYIAKAVNDYALEFADRPQCFTYDKFFPQTWLLNEKEECDEFFAIFNSEEYKKKKETQRIVYIRKQGAGAHRGLGVQPVNDVEEEEIRKIWSNGKGCGTVTKNYIIQHYIPNPLLLNDRKFDFRMYLLIASTKPLMGFYHDGFLRVTISEYDVNSDDKSILMTNLALNEDIYSQLKNGTLYNGMNEEELKRAQQWSFERLHDYLFEKGIVTDPNWLDNYLRPEMKKAMVHLMRLATRKFLKNSSMYELFGVDFMLDTDLGLWFIEANSTPAFDGYSEPMEDFIVKMLQDHVEVVNGLLKSRMKRIIAYVNNLTHNGIAVRNSVGKLALEDVEQRKKEFNDVIQNRFEPEFLPSATNGFSKIYDDNLEGADKYMGFINEDCL